MNKSLYNIGFVSLRYFHMVLIAFLNIIFGFGFALINSFIFPPTSLIIKKYEQDSREYNPLVYLEIVAFIILEIFVIVLEIYLIRNVVKMIGMFLTRNLIFNDKINYVFYKEYSSNIMLGYVIYLFSYELNERFSFLIEQINPDAVDPLTRDYETHLEELHKKDSNSNSNSNSNS